MKAKEPENAAAGRSKTKSSSHPSEDKRQAQSPHGSRQSESEAARKERSANLVAVTIKRA